MANLMAAKKRVRQEKKRVRHNKWRKGAMESSLRAHKKKPTKKSVSTAQSHIDRAANDGIIHPNKAARLKSRLQAKA